MIRFPIKPFHPRLNRGHPLAKGLILCMPFTELGGAIAYDLSGKKNDGAINDTVVRVNTPFGGGLKFLISGDYVRINDSNSLDLTNKFTITMWVKVDDLNKTQIYVLSKLNNASNDNVYSVVWEYFSDSIEFYSGEYTGDNPRTGSSIFITDLNWHHIIYTYDGATWEGYKDGTKVFSLSKSFVLGVSTGNLYLSTFNGSARMFPGIIDNVMIWDRGLNQNEVSQIYRDSFAMLRFMNAIRLPAISRGFGGLINAGLINGGFVR